MIWTVFRIAIGRLSHNRIELLLTFVVPIAFFSIFAVIFGKGLGGSNTPKIKAVVIDVVGSPQSRQVIDRIRKLDGLRLLDTQDGRKPLDETQARELVRRGMVTIAVVLKKEGDQLAAELLSDASDQVAGQVCSALVAQTLLAPPVSITQPQSVFRPQIPSDQVPSDQVPQGQVSPGQVTQGQIPPGQVTQAKFDASEVAEDPEWMAGIAAARPVPMIAARANVRIVDVISGEKANPVVSMYAAGIAVMFLLFGATGAGGSLLEEQESHTLHRLLTTRLTMDHLLLGKWLYQTILGTVQVCVMFLWGWLVFGVDLWGHLDGFLLMTVVTAGAAASFGLLLATFSRTRGQLNGISVILILSMSALGGSMVPRYLMSDSLRGVGLYTFNAWALDGFDKVFWRELPIGELWPQICVLMISGAVFLIVARVLAIRWETA